MIKHRFKYVKIGSYLRPIIPVTLQNERISFAYLALIDSGADFNIFHGELASILNIDLKRLKTIQFGGINKDAPGVGYYTAIEIGVQDQFFNTPVVFSHDISDRGYGILGQQGFFNLFKVKFDFAAKSIQLKTNR